MSPPLLLGSSHSWGLLGGFGAYENEDDATRDLFEFSLANALYAALVEGHACEQSARYGFVFDSTDVLLTWPMQSQCDGQCVQERLGHDWRADHEIQPRSSSRHYQRVGRHHYRFVFHFLPISDILTNNFPFQVQVLCRRCSWGCTTQSKYCRHDTGYHQYIIISLILCLRHISDELHVHCK